MPKTPSKTATVKKKPEQRGLIEQDFIAKGHSLLGIDEVGRGCLAGPVYAACVALDYAALARLDASTKSLIRDSKTLSSKQRQKIIPFVLSISIETAVASASVAEVENLGIVGANFQAMQRAFVMMRGKYDRVLIDGNQKNPLIPMDQTAIIGGDMLCYAIAAASILAKEARDDFMRSAAQDYPAYHFSENVGYGTKSHLTALEEHGITPLHRRNFSPIQRYAEAGHFAKITTSIGPMG